MPFAKNPALDVEGFGVQRLGFVDVADVFEGVREIVKRCCEGRMRRAVQLPAHRNGFAQDLHRHAVMTLVEVGEAEIL